MKWMAILWLIGGACLGFYCFQALRDGKTGVRTLRSSRVGISLGCFDVQRRTSPLAFLCLFSSQVLFLLLALVLSVWSYFSGMRWQ